MGRAAELTCLTPAGEERSRVIRPLDLVTRRQTFQNPFEAETAWKKSLTILMIFYIFIVSLVFCLFLCIIKRCFDSLNVVV